VFSLKSFLRPRGSEAGPLTDTSRPRSETNKTTEKLVYKYSNSKMAAAVRDASELKMFAGDTDDVWPVV
jgi:hypothetical protein